MSIPDRGLDAVTRYGVPAPVSPGCGMFFGARKNRKNRK